MITIEANEIKYQLPDSWLEMKLGQLIAISNIDPLLDEIDKIVETIHILSGIPKEVVLNIPFTEYSKLLEVMSYLSTDIPNDLFKSWKFNDVEYQFNCNLETMTTAEYLDLDKCLKDGSTTTLPMLMAIMYRPENERYDWIKCKKRAELFSKEMPVSVAISAQVFLSVLEQNCLNYIQVSSTEA